MLQRNPLSPSVLAHSNHQWKANYGLFFHGLNQETLFLKSQQIAISGYHRYTWFREIIQLTSQKLWNINVEQRQYTFPLLPLGYSSGLVDHESSNLATESSDQTCADSIDSSSRSFDLPLKLYITHCLYLTHRWKPRGHHCTYTSFLLIRNHWQWTSIASKCEMNRRWANVCLKIPRSNFIS